MEIKPNFGVRETDIVIVVLYVYVYLSAETQSNPETGLNSTVR